MTWPSTPRGDAGSVSVELVVLVPAFAVILALVLLVGRVQVSRANIEAASHAAARSITLSRDPHTAAEDAKAATAKRVGAGSRSCQAMGWNVEVTATDATVTVSCEVNLAEAALLPVDRTMTVTSTSTEVFDRFMEARP